MIRTFHIAYALPWCTISRISEVLDPLFDNQIISIEEELTEDDKGFFKQFWVSTEESRLVGGMRRILEEIHLLGSARVIYSRNGELDRFWNITLSQN